LGKKSWNTCLNFSLSFTNSAQGENVHYTYNRDLSIYVVATVKRQEDGSPIECGSGLNEAFAFL
jgi:hypothetical protein